MLTTRYFAASVGAGAVGAAVLLAGQSAPSAATPQRMLASDVRLSAQAFNLARVLPWAVGPSTGAAAVSGALDPNDPATAAAAATLQTLNQLGPLAFGLDSIRSIGVSQTVPGTNNTLGTVNSTDQWAAGLAGIVNSKGAVGFTEAAAQYDPFMANHAGFLQTSNQFGPAVFDLNVLKAIGFFQAPTGTLLASGYPDNASAVDIGRWRAGIPGFIMNTGTTGFVDNADMGPGPIQASAVGGLHTTTQIGSATFDVNVLPTVGAGIMPYGVSFGLSPDMTADGTPFAPITPPAPGTITPPPPVTSPPLAPTPLIRTAAVEPEADAPVVETARSSEPKEAIPGVNGAPLAKTPPKASPAGGGSAPLNPFAPLKPFSDMVKSGISSFTGTGPASGGASPDAGGAGGSGDGGE